MTDTPIYLDGERLPEQALIGACLVDPRELDSLSRSLRGEHFLDPKLGAMFDALIVLRESGKPFDVPVLLATLPTMGVPQGICSASGLARLMHAGGNSFGLAMHAETVRDAHHKRKLRTILEQAARRLDEPTSNAGDVAALLEESGTALDLHTGDVAETLADCQRAAIAEARAASERPTGTIATGIGSLDQLLGPLCPGELVVIGARPGIGKTTLAMQIAQRAAIEGKSTLMVNLEQPSVELGAKTLSQQLRIDARRLRSGSLDPAILQRCEQVASDFDDLSLRLWCPATATLRRIRGVARYVARRFGLSLLVVDYLQLIDAERGGKLDRYQHIGEVSRSLKALAKELGIVVIAPAQLNRKSDEIEKPRLSHLRESGSIEQDSDRVFLLHRLNDDSTDELVPYLLDVAKNRHGLTREVALAFDTKRQRFAEAPADWLNQQPEPRSRKKRETTRPTIPATGREWNGE